MKRADLLADRSRRNGRCGGRPGGPPRHGRRATAVPQFGDQLDLHPRARVTRGGRTGDGTWLPLPNVSASAAGWVR